MIKSKDDLIHYLNEDAKANRHTGIKPRILADEIWKFIYALRMTEYYINTGKKITLVSKVVSLFWEWRLHVMGVKCGFSISPNVFEEGMSIAHRGTIVVNGNAKIGKYCRIHEGVTIGSTNGSSLAPQIGNYVFLGSGCKIIGDIKIQDSVSIGAGAVVVKDINEANSTWAGVPARMISKKGSDCFFMFLNNEN